METKNMIRCQKCMKVFHESGITVYDNIEFCPYCGNSECFENLSEHQSEIRVKIPGGFIVAGRNPDSEYDGVYVVFESDEGDILDLALVECKAENERKKIDVYTYEDVWNEDYTGKFTLNVCDILNALAGEAERE